jgi:hypothetical protein
MPTSKNVNVTKVIRTVYRVNEIPSAVAPPVISAWASKLTVKPEVKPEILSKPSITIPSASLPPSSSPTSPRPGFLEPLSPTPSTQLQANMEIEMTVRVANYWNWQMDHPGFWEEKIEQLEKRREKYNTKGGWSAKDSAAADLIDEELKYCFKELQQLKEDMNYSEDDADIDEPI